MLDWLKLILQARFPVFYIQLPIALFGGSGNYASALYIAAVKANSLDNVESELVNFVEAIKKSPTFSQFTMDLSVPAETRVKAITEISAEAKFSDVVKNFLGRIHYSSLVVWMKTEFSFGLLCNTICLLKCNSFSMLMF